jgi:hypothetical protein
MGVWIRAELPCHIQWNTFNVQPFCHLCVCVCLLSPFSLIFLTQYFLLQPICDLISTTTPFVRFSWISAQVIFPFKKKTSSKREFRENRGSENHTSPRGINDFLPVISIFPALVESSCVGLEGNGRRLFTVSSAIFLEVHNKPWITQISIIICSGMRITDNRDSLISADRK